MQWALFAGFCFRGRFQIFYAGLSFVPVLLRFHQTLSQSFSRPAGNSVGLLGVPVVLFGRRHPLDCFQVSIEEDIEGSVSIFHEHRLYDSNRFCGADCNAFIPELLSLRSDRWTVGAGTRDICRSRVSKFGSDDRRRLFDCTDKSKQRTTRIVWHFQKCITRNSYSTSDG